MAACLVVSVASWFVDIRLSRSILEEIRARDFYGKDGFKDIVERLNEQEKTIGARVDELDRTPGWTQPSVNKALLLRAASRQPLKFSIADKTWRAYEANERSEEERKHLLLRFVVARALAAGQRIFNGRKVRMCSDLRDALIHGLAIQPTDYLSSMITDGIAFQLVTSLNGKTIYSDGFSFFLQPANGSYRLRSLADTESSNQLGASTLAFTSDGYLILVHQTLRNAHSQGKIAPSGSGSFDWEDVEATKSEDFLDVIRRGARESWSRKAASKDIPRSPWTWSPAATSCLMPLLG